MIKAPQGEQDHWGEGDGPRHAQGLELRVASWSSGSRINIRDSQVSGLGNWEVGGIIAEGRKLRTTWGQKDSGFLGS